ncbi:MAG TPA: hypothetical protein VG711_00565 [Phycisphaerales bacterium]|nr:hypothetical protein [Phycisphaerales bacterium]
MRPRRIHFTLLCLTGVICAASFVWRLSRAAPSWYNPPDVISPEQARSAETVEYNFIQKFQELRPPAETWILRVREYQLNDWLAVRLPAWIAHDPSLDWPSELGTPQLHIDETGVTLAVSVKQADTVRYVSARLAPKLDDKGSIHVTIDRISLGKLALPVDASEYAVNLLSRTVASVQQKPDTVNAAQELLTAIINNQSVDAGFKLADDRRVRIKNITLADGYMEITSCTLPAESTRSAKAE